MSKLSLNINIDNFGGRLSTVTWFGRSDLALCCLLNSLEIGNRSILSLGSGPLEWTILGRSDVEGLYLVDISPFVENIMWRLVRGDSIALSEIEEACRNNPDEANIDLADPGHLQAGLEKLLAAGLISKDDISTTLEGGIISLSADYRARLQFSRMDVAEFLAGSSVEDFGLIQISNLLTQLIKVANSEQQMNAFYRNLPYAATHIQTTIGHFRDQNSVNSNVQFSQHLCDDLEGESIDPQAIVCVDAILSKGKLRGSYSILANCDLDLAISAWVSDLNNKYGCNILWENVAIDSWLGWQKTLGADFVLAMQKRDDGDWNQARISAAAFQELLTKKEKLTFGTNFYDGLQLFCPAYQP